MDILVRTVLILELDDVCRAQHLSVFYRINLVSVGFTRFGKCGGHRRVLSIREKRNDSGLGRL
jgi:hypothetical protein